MRSVILSICFPYMAYCLIQASVTPILGGDSTSTLFTAPLWYLRDGVSMHEWFYPLQVYGMLIQAHVALNGFGTPIISTAFMCASAILLWRMGNKYSGEGAGELAMLAYLLLNIGRISAYYGLNEHLYVFLLLLAVDSLLSKRWWYVGVFLGILTGVDYTSWVFVIIVAMLAKRSWFKVLGAAVLLAVPWYLPNVLTYGNPVFPFFATRALEDVTIIASAAPHQYEFGWAFLFLVPFAMLCGKKLRPVLIISIVSLVLLCAIAGAIHARFMMPALALLVLPIVDGFVTRIADKVWQSTIAVWLIVYMLFFVTPLVNVSVPQSNAEIRQTITGFYPRLEAVERICLLHPYSKIYFPPGMESYRYYTTNDVVASIADADFVITPYAGYRPWVKIEKLQLRREYEHGLISLFDQRSADFLGRTWVQSRKKPHAESANKKHSGDNR